MSDLLKSGSHGQAVADLQALLIGAGYRLERNHVYDDATVKAVSTFQRSRGLVVDGKYGTKTASALAGLDTTRVLKEVDLIRAAETLRVPLATIKAVNEVESNGSGFLPDGRPVILFERHVFYRELEKTGIDPKPLAMRFPGIVNRERGGYAGKAAEYSRLATARSICAPAALSSASWGAFQIMGYHWQLLGFDSVDAFVASMSESEGKQLDAFVSYVLADPALSKALAGRKWATFARAYNGSAYAENLYDVKLARAYERYADIGSAKVAA